MKVFSIFLILGALYSCGDSDSGGATNPATSIKQNVSNYMASAAPSTGASSMLYYNYAFAPADWTNTSRGVKRPGDGSSATSIAGYFTDLFNPEYAVDSFSPTVFGRFEQEMEILEIVGAQVAFSNGIPAVGTHSITAEIGDDGTSTTFDVVVAQATDPNFDVTLNITDPFVWKAALKNSDNKVNLVSAEVDGDSDRSVSILFWDTTTGKLRYDFIAKQGDGTLAEVHRLMVEETDGQAYIGHIYEDNGVKNYAAVSAPQGSDSTTFSVSFAFADKVTPGNSFAAETYCIQASNGSATDNACAGQSLPNNGDADDLGTLWTTIDGEASGKTLIERILGTNYADMEDVSFNYDLGSMTTFLTALPE